MNEINLKDWTINSLRNMLDSDSKLELSSDARSAVKHCRQFLDDYLKERDDPVYGINTGFGSLYNTLVSKDELEQLQENLVMSHACGTGAKVPENIVKVILLLKIKGLSKGHSGISEEVIDRLLWHYNENVLPVIFEQGSLGASGDLAPLAHLSLPLIGAGEVYYNGQISPANEVLGAYNMQPLGLRSKEGLALLNGTQFMSGYASYILMELEHLQKWSTAIAALSLDAYDGRPEPFSNLVHDLRPHDGQKQVASEMLQWLEGSEILTSMKAHVQDPYCLRCIPQVHGASFDAIAHVRSVVEREISSVTDNPTIFPNENRIISAGNFHGQPLALALDYLAIAMAELGSISERRTYKLISGQRELPAFLVAKPGLNSGLMIAQYTAASLVSQNKQLCTPSSVDTIDSSNGQEDHVSMGANGATKAYRVLENLKHILAIELINASQALTFRNGKTSPKLERILGVFRAVVPPLEKDRTLHYDIIAAKNFISTVAPE